MLERFTSSAAASLLSRLCAFPSGRTRSLALARPSPTSAAVPRVCERVCARVRWGPARGGLPGAPPAPLATLDNHCEPLTSPRAPGTGVREARPGRWGRGCRGRAGAGDRTGGAGHAARSGGRGLRGPFSHRRRRRPRLDQRDPAAILPVAQRGQRKERWRKGGGGSRRRGLGEPSSETGNRRSRRSRGRPLSPARCSRPRGGRRLDALTGRGGGGPAQRTSHSEAFPDAPTCLCHGVAEPARAPARRTVRETPPKSLPCPIAPSRVCMKPGPPSAHGRPGGGGVVDPPAQKSTAAARERDPLFNVSSWVGGGAGLAGGGRRGSDAPPPPPSSSAADGSSWGWGGRVTRV